jgi:hypothetical protein
MHPSSHSVGSHPSVPETKVPDECTGPPAPHAFFGAGWPQRTYLLIFDCVVLVQLGIVLTAGVAEIEVMSLGVGRSRRHCPCPARVLLPSSQRQPITEIEKETFKPGVYTLNVTFKSWCLHLQKRKIRTKMISFMAEFFCVFFRWLLFS